MKNIPENIKNKFSELKGFSLFNGFEIQDILPLLTAAKIYHFNDKKVLLRQDEIATHLCIILSGNVQTYRLHQDGREFVVSISSKGDTLFENIIFSHAKSTTCSAVIKSAEIFMVPAKVVQKFTAHNASFATNIVKILAEKTNQMMFQQELIALHSAKERLGAFLLSTMLDQKKHRSSFKLSFEKSLIARHLAMTPETLSRTLKEFRVLGVEVNGNSVKLKNSCSLCQFYDTLLACKCDKEGTSDCPHYEKSA